MDKDNYKNCGVYKLKDPNGICIGNGSKCKTCPAHIRYINVIKKEKSEAGDH